MSLFQEDDALTVIVHRLCSDGEWPDAEVGERSVTDAGKSSTEQITRSAPGDFLSGMPDEVAGLIRSAGLCEFATVSKGVVPIDTPVGCFWGPTGTINVTTGLAYPTKAERARNNPKVGILLEGFRDEPVALVAGHAAVRDADINANIMRYLPEISSYFDTFAAGHSWDSARQAVHYWARIIIEVTPLTVWWWRSADMLDRTPERWDAPPDTTLPKSDPAPQGEPSSAPRWPGEPWQIQAEEVVAQALPAHLTTMGEAGFPLSIRVWSCSPDDRGFLLDVPRGFPGPVSGAATLCFAGRSTFVGDVLSTDGATLFRVERALPALPFTRDLSQLWAPSEETRGKLTARLEQELARRNQPMPVLPLALPEPTSGCLMREARNRRMTQEMQAVGPHEAAAPYIVGQS